MQILMSHSLCFTLYIFIHFFTLKWFNLLRVSQMKHPKKKSNCTLTPISVTSSEQVKIWFSVLKYLNFSWLQNFPRIHQVLWVKSFFETLHNPDGLRSHLLTQQHPLPQTHSVLPRTRAVHGQGSPTRRHVSHYCAVHNVTDGDMQICFHLGMIIPQYPQRSVTGRQVTRPIQTIFELAEVLRFSVFIVFSVQRHVTWPISRRTGGPSAAPLDHCGPPPSDSGSSHHPHDLQWDLETQS